jgi:hypothetical protein
MKTRKTMTMEDDRWGAVFGSRSREDCIRASEESGLTIRMWVADRVRKAIDSGLRIEDEDRDEELTPRAANAAVYRALVKQF